MDWNVDLASHLVSLLTDEEPDSAILFECFDYKETQLVKIGVLPPRLRALSNEVARLMNLHGELCNVPIWVPLDEMHQSDCNALACRVLELSNVLCRSIQFCFSSESDMYLVDMDWQVSRVLPDETSAKNTLTSIVSLDSYRKGRT